MIVPDEVRKCVVFVAYRMADESFRMAGSAFFIGFNIPESTRIKSFLVTAKHVLDKIRALGLNEIWLRFNSTDGQSRWFRSIIDDWKTHPTDLTADVAVHPAGIPEYFDHLAIPRAICISDELISEHNIGLGEEVFITGLFRHHIGSQRNIPIVRVGTLAARNEERISTSTGTRDALLIEARSIGGLSGSPVFFNLGTVRLMSGQLKISDKQQPLIFLSGLIHGHYDIPSANVDDAIEDHSLSIEKINTGIAIVTPIHKVLETIDHHSTAGTANFAISE